MSQYTASVPSDGAVKPEIRAFFEKFYAVSDTPGGHEQYADMFTGDGTLIMGPNKTQGRDNIIKMREGMWVKVAKRSHQPKQLYPFGSGSNDIMLFGTVDYTLREGGSTSLDWAARARFVEHQGGLKLDHYQVYLDTASMTPKN
ncbi:uncharacterized protein MYCFIDRAFT_185494 [Pseudocercospora fijiensis CIRAD86]|uniref:SnoaL-like domain-containing protein n=1 Tax=Pseudocercospora fijiensis (strain CIRAD86) TaxID=383855 RepID=N1Q874_PSEFD|nr:uncharacterized protein MYCFIDRAFT_185494 [Pseudocercospora fijiensis CIRAD86]EME89055.1 hypothetical protein MYCFIDRAFT_185494 [Pseudocercospora fijiensis CIRAD86]